MSDSAERMVNLALFLASSPRYVTAIECRNAGLGYDERQDDVAFIRMFERDKDALRAAGLVIEVARDEGIEAYRLDAEASFARPVNLEADELAALRAVAATLAEDPAFPFADDLALALGKLGAAGVTGPLATADLADAADPRQTLCARALAEAVGGRKSVTFDYTNARGEDKHHAVDPYGVFFREGSWYMTGRDHDTDALRTYAVTRIRDLDVNPLRPRTPDFERPADFDIREQERLPFQYGEHAVTAELRFEPDVAWRAERLARGRGSLQYLPDGSALWRVEAGDLERLASFIIAEGPSIHAVGPPELLRVLAEGLKAVCDAHA